MKLLAIEAKQNAAYYVSRYEQVEALGAGLYVLNGEGTPGTWPDLRYRIVGSKHIDAIVDAAREWHADETFDGVLTFSEAAVMTVAAVTSALGLPGIGLDAARASRNKLVMRQAHQRAGASHPQFRFVEGVGEALEAAEDFGYPVILKPTLGAASNFVFRIDSSDELLCRLPQAAEGIRTMTWFDMEADGLDLGPNGLMIESFLDGREILIEALEWDGEVYLGSIVDRVTVEGDTFDDDVHSAPTSLTESELDAVRRVVRVGVRGQGLRRSVLHAEVRFHDGEPFLLEIAARPGGGGLDHMARLSAGYCPIRATIDAACGVRPELDNYRPTELHTAAMCLLCDSGRIEHIEIPEHVTGSDNVFFFKITARPGDLIRRPPLGNNILGFLGATGSSFENAMRTAVELANDIHVRVAS